MAHLTLAQLAPLIEVLEHGRDGRPRAVTATIDADVGLAQAMSHIGAEAVARGYVAMTPAQFLRVRTTAREQIDGRTLLLIASDDDVVAHRALSVATASSPRPHVLLTLRTAATSRPYIVREARPIYGGRPRSLPAAPLAAAVAQHLQRAARAAEFVAAGRHAAAARLLRDVAASLRRRKADTHAAAVLQQLGRIQLERGRASAAVDLFGEAAECWECERDGRASPARLWQASACIDAAQLTRAEAVARAVLLVDTSPAMAAWAGAVLARLLCWQGRDEEAEIPAVVALDAHESTLDVETATYIDAMRVRLLLRRGDVFAAGLQARRLVDASEAHPVAAQVIARTAHLRVLAASGDLAAVRACLETVCRLARATRSPLRTIRARLIWIDALARAGRSGDAGAERRRLQRMSRVMPPLLRDTIERQERPSAIVTGPRMPDVSAAALVRLCHEDGDDGSAIERSLEAVRRRLDAARLDLWSRDAGPATVVITVGTGLQSTLGERALDAGIALTSEAGRAPETAVPVRLGDTLLAALACRWPADRTARDGTRDALDVLAAVIAPRVDALMHRRRQEARAASVIPELLGASAAMEDVRRAVLRAAASPYAVLIEGESGVGKELVARALHALSPRRERRFCDVNCAALPDDLLESELFGHSRGAFTGAVTEKAGVFEAASGGTLFFDEIADLSLRGQAKLLRVLQQQEVRRVGETFSRPVDVRVVSAANRDMRAEAAQGRFRQDLLYRVDVLRISIPPLRERPEDVMVLAEHVWRTAAARVGTAATLSRPVLSSLASYRWPGNVRELQNVLAALAVAAPRRGRVPPHLLPAAIIGAAPLRAIKLADAREEFERRFVEGTLARTGGNRARAARALGLSRQGLLKVMARLGIGGDKPATGAASPDESETGRGTMGS